MTIARLYDNGFSVRIDMGNTGKKWPNSPLGHIGFMHLEKRSEGRTAWEDAEEYAKDHGATEIVKEK